MVPVGCGILNVVVKKCRDLLINLPKIKTSMPVIVFWMPFDVDCKDIRGVYKNNIFIM